MKHSIGQKIIAAARVSPAIGLVVAGHALAQQAPQAAPQAAPDMQQLPDIVVTAQKRSSTVDKTPISMTAVSGEDLQDRGVTSFATLAGETPGVSMKTNGPGQTEFEMRGMTSSGGNSPTVGFYLDDIPLTAPAAAQNGKVVIDPSLYDLARVEVLRGPQGTLYGSSSMGGTIKLVTNQPKLTKFEGSAEAILSGTDGGGFNHNENVMLNVPLMKDELALRLVASQASTSGWIDRIVAGNFPSSTAGGAIRGDVQAAPVVQDNKGSNAETMKSGRATLAWKPTAQLTITPSIFYQYTSQEGPNFYDSVPGTQAHYQPFGIQEPYSDSVTISSLNLEYKFDAFDLTSSTSNWHRLSRLIQDGSENVPSVGGGFGGPGVSTTFYGPNGTGPIYGLELDPSNQFSEELRAASTGDGPLKWVGGFYYSKFQSNWQLFTDFPNPAAFGSSTTNLFTLDQPTQIKQDAIFGEATYSVTEKLHLTGGLRWYHYDSQLDMSFSGYGSASGNDTPTITHVTQANSGVNPKFDISYDLDKDILVYATAARGFRPGGGNQPLPTTGPAGPSILSALQGLGYTNGVSPRSFQPDSLWSYEVGEKARFLDNRLGVNASVFFENWKNIQLEELPFGYPIFDNVNTAHIYGGELEMRAAVLQSLTLGASVGYTHATLAESSHGFVAGQLLPDVPKFSGTVSATYHTYLSDRYEFTSRIENSYMGNRVDLGTAGGLVNDTQAPLPSYDLTNLRAAINSEDGWSTAVFVNNLTNKHAYLENVAQLTLPNAAFNRVATNQPRTIGVDLSYRF